MVKILKKTRKSTVTVLEFVAIGNSSLRKSNNRPASTSSWTVNGTNR